LRAVTILGGQQSEERLDGFRQRLGFLIAIYDNY